MASSSFSELQQNYFKEFFDFFDHDKIGRIQTEDVPTVIRACGAVPLEADLEMLKSLADREKRGSCDFDGLCTALQAAFNSSIGRNDVRDAFLGFDSQGKGTLPMHELRYFLTSLGDALSADEMNGFAENMQSELDIEGNLVLLDAVEKMAPEFLR